jgi:hypothetical protein
MPIDVSTWIEVTRPADTVAGLQFDPDHDPRWIGGVDSTERLTHGPLDVGSRVRRLGRFMGRRIEWVMEIVEIVPARRLAMHAVRSPFPMDVTYEIEPSSGGSRVGIRVQGEAYGLFRLFGPLLGPMVRRSVAGDLRRLKALVESSPVAGS